MINPKTFQHPVVLKNKALNYNSKCFTSRHNLVDKSAGKTHLLPSDLISWVWWCINVYWFGRDADCNSNISITKKMWQLQVQKFPRKDAENDRYRDENNIHVTMQKSNKKKEGCIWHSWKVVKCERYLREDGEHRR